MKYFIRIFINLNPPCSLSPEFVNLHNYFLYCWCVCQKVGLYRTGYPDLPDIRPDIRYPVGIW